MRIFFTFIFLLEFSLITAQTPQSPPASRSSSGLKVNFDGQWRGGFNEKNFLENIQYVLELNVNGSQVGGYSYTYFNEPPHKYYTICRITGSLNRLSNEIVVTEVERLKYNTPPGFLNCFQTHRLHYEKKNGEEILKGTWIPAPNQAPGCGSGVTILSRRPPSHTPMGTPQSKSRELAITPKKSAPSTHRNVTPPKKTPSKVAPDVAEVPKAPKPSIAFPQDDYRNITPPKPLERKELIRRRADIVKTIDVSSPMIRLDFYDNGEIDGDSITVTYNGRIVLSNQMLTDKPLTMRLEVPAGFTENVLTMHAENLGSIPPNTAVMIVTDGNTRYEVRLESDLKKSGSVIFRRKP